MAARCRVRLDRLARGLDLPAICPLGLGRRLAGRTRGQLRPRPRVCGCRRLELDSSGGWPDRTGYCLDLRPSARQVRDGRDANCHPRTQCRLRSIWLPRGAYGMAGHELRWRPAVYQHRPGTIAFDRGQHHAGSVCGNPDNRGAYSHALRQTRRFTERQRLGRRTRGQLGGLSFRHADRRVDDWAGRRGFGHLLRPVARIAFGG